MTQTLSLWRQRAWRCLALLCCAVVLSQSVPTLTASAPLVAADTDAESEDSAPSRDDDDGDGESGLVSSSSPLRCRSSFRRLCLTVLRHNRVAHLPHHHHEQAGFHLPVCTPFARGGALLPLRC